MSVGCMNDGYRSVDTLADLSRVCCFSLILYYRAMPQKKKRKRRKKRKPTLEVRCCEGLYLARLVLFLRALAHTHCFILSRSIQVEWTCLEETMVETTRFFLFQPILSIHYITTTRAIVVLLLPFTRRALESLLLCVCIVPALCCCRCCCCCRLCQSFHFLLERILVNDESNVMAGDLTNEYLVLVR